MKSAAPQRGQNMKQEIKVVSQRSRNLSPPRGPNVGYSPCAAAVLFRTVFRLLLKAAHSRMLPSGTRLLAGLSWWSARLAGYAIPTGFPERGGRQASDAIVRTVRLASTSPRWRHPAYLPKLPGRDAGSTVSASLIHLAPWQSRTCGRCAAWVRSRSLVHGLERHVAEAGGDVRGGRSRRRGRRPLQEALGVRPADASAQGAGVTERAGSKPCYVTPYYLPSHARAFVNLPWAALA